MFREKESTWELSEEWRRKELWHMERRLIETKKSTHKPDSGALKTNRFRGGLEWCPFNDNAHNNRVHGTKASQIDQ